MVVKRVLLAIGGGIAAYKSAMLCSRLVQADLDVQVAITHSGSRFIGPPTLAALSGKPVAMDMFDPQFPSGGHIELVESIDLMIVAPATANLMSDFACGRASDLVTTCYLQTESPVLLAPAMSSPMWEKPAVTRNVQQLRDDGCQFVGPESGWLACRKIGRGRMSEPEQILSAAFEILGG